MSRVHAGWAALSFVWVSAGAACDPSDAPPGAAPSAAGATAAEAAAPSAELSVPEAQAPPSSSTTAPPAPAGRPQPDAAVAPQMAPELQLAFVGDIIFGRYRADGFDPIVEGELQPFAAMRDALAADLTIANLETPLVENLPAVSPSRAEYRFGASREMAQHLVEGGFDVLSVANNHHNDQREAGHRETLKILADLDIKTMGDPRAEAPALRFETVRRKGWNVAFVAVTTRLNMPLGEAPPHIPFVQTKELAAQLAEGIEQARASHDLVVVSVHWGEEYTEQPTFRQRQAARALIDAGADVVFGHHPHVLQGVELHGDGVIAYSMGNFLFENASSVPRLTGVLRLRFRRAEGRGRPCLSLAHFVPAVMARKPYHHPVPVGEDRIDGRRVRERLRRLSAKLSSDWGQAEADAAGAAGGAWMQLQSQPSCAREPSGASGSEHVQDE